MKIRYWLMKTEPDVFSIDDLAAKKKAPWDGVRNYQARNFMRDQMKIGDEVLFYHSSTDPSGVAGRARVCSAAYPDSTAWDPKSTVYDPRSLPDRPVWFMVDVEFVEKFKNFVSLSFLKNDSRFAEMRVVQPGSRLSVQPVSKKHFDLIYGLGR